MGTKKKTAELTGFAAQKERMGADGSFNGWWVVPAKYKSPRSDPKHPEHQNWLARTDPNDADMQVLLASMREHGTALGTPIVVYTDGGERLVAAGDRRLAAVTIVNAERRAKRQELLKLRAVATTDPVRARYLENAARKEDPPLVLARRFKDAMENDGMAPPAAAACAGLRLDTANALVKCLLLDSDLQGKINRKEITPDVALRLAKNGGSAAVREAVTASTDSEGKVDGKAVRKAAKAASPPRAKTRSAKEIERVEGDLLKSGVHGRVMAAEALAWARGGEPPAWLREIVAKAKPAKKKGGA